MITEEFLHYVWKLKLFNQKNLFTEQGEALSIIKTGEHNNDAGPDFFNAKIKIGKTTWAGNVEIHTLASDWKKHKHQNDAAYNNVILHVVYKNDIALHRKSGENFPTLVLDSLIPRHLLDNYNTIQKSTHWIPCEKQLKDIDAFVVKNWLDRMLVERLERKTKSILDSLAINKNNWEETFYQHISKSFGFKINSVPFELLAKSIPNKLLAKHKNSLLQIESLLYGQAGFLELPYIDKYAQQLQNEYAFLQNKYSLAPIEKHLWKNMRLHPSNFPCVRIAQFAALIYKSSHLFSKILEAKSIIDLKKLLSVETSEYWTTHYQFDKQSPLKKKKLGADGIENIIINTVVPLYFAYGKTKKEEGYVNLAMDLLEHLKSEKNSIITKWNKIGIATASAFDSQALLELKNEYCSHKKCLHCSVGNKLLNRV